MEQQPPITPPFDVPQEQQALLELQGPREEIGRPDRADDMDPLGAGPSEEGGRTRGRGELAPPKRIPTPEEMPPVVMPPWAAAWLAQPQEVLVPDATWTQEQLQSWERFPPGALVKGLRPLAVPQAGTVAIVVGVYSPIGDVKVRQHPDALMITGVDPAWLEVVARRGAAGTVAEEELDDGDVPL